MNAPVAIFVYNRPTHLRMTLSALAGNQLARDTDLHVFSDGPKTPADAVLVAEVRSLLRTVSGFRSLKVVERSQNLGLAQSIIEGVGEMCQCYGRVIVLEDDMVTSPFFLRYMNDALTLYEADESIISIHAYMFPNVRLAPETFFLRGADCWGWATWQRAWRLFNTNGQSLLSELRNRGLCHQFDLDGAYGYCRMLEDQVAGRNDSWAVRWYASAFLLDKLTLWPGHSLVCNIGMDGSGTHCRNNRLMDTVLANRPICVQRVPQVEDVEMRRKISVALAGNVPRLSLVRRLLARL